MTWSVRLNGFPLGRAAEGKAQPLRKRKAALTCGEICSEQDHSALFFLLVFHFFLPHLSPRGTPRLRASSRPLAPTRAGGGGQPL